ncbi:MAG: hypothetical protein WCH60_16560 [Burkholderiales bacterium]
MERNHKKDAAFNQLLSNMLDGSVHAAELAGEIAVERGEQLVALQHTFANAPAAGFRSGQIVQWKSGMKNRSKPAYSEPVIVMEVLTPPVFDTSKEMAGSNLFREPLTLVLGLHDTDGDFLLFHYDGRRFELALESGVEHG